MRKKQFRKYGIIMAIIFMLSMVGCSSFRDPSNYHNLSERYNKETDYSMNYIGMYLPVMTAADNGYYFAAEDFLFFWEPGLEEAAFFCNRPECEHWDDRCPAHFYRSSDDLVQYYEGKLYVVTNEYSDAGEYACNLYQVNPSDCTREKLCQLPYGLDDTVRYMLHRGYLYMYSYDSLKREVVLERVPLNKLRDENFSPEKLYAEASISYRIPYIYGNHIFLSCTEDIGDHYVWNWSDINLITGEKREITIPNAEENSYIHVQAEYEDKLILTYISSEKATWGSYEMKYYSYDCNNGEVVPLVTLPDRGETAYEYLYWDGKNLLSFFYDQLSPYDEINVTQDMRILNSDFEPVKIMPIDVNMTGFMVGDEDYSFIGHDMTGYTLYAIDKNADTLSYELIFDMPAFKLTVDY